MRQPHSATGDTLHVACVLFDLYGTLVHVQLDEDSPALWDGLAAFLAPRPGVGPNEVRASFRAILQEEMQRREEGFIMEPVFRRLLAAVGSRRDVEALGGWFRKLSLRESRLADFVVPLFGELRRTGVRIGIVSNTEAVLTRFDLHQYQVLQTADVTILSSEVGVRKPAPVIFRLALERIGAAAGSAVFVGNSVREDIEGATAVGMRALYLDDAAREVELLPSVGQGARRVPPTLAGILAALKVCGWAGTRTDA